MKMRFVLTAMTVMTMALLLSLGTVPVLAASAPGSDKPALQERKSQHTAAKRNAAAKALKAKLNKGQERDARHSIRQIDSNSGLFITNS